MKEKSVSELKAMIDSGTDFQLIDVREPQEYEICNIKGTLIPMNDIPEHIGDIPDDKPVVIHCKMGGRSAAVVQYLEQAHGFENLYNLSGGINAWADEIDHTMPKY